MAIWSQNRYIVGSLVLVILGHWSLTILEGAPFLCRQDFHSDGTLHRSTAESNLDSWIRMSVSGDQQQNYSCNLHLCNVLRLHRSFAEHIQAHWNNLFPLARFEGSRAPHSSDFYRWPHFLYTCVRVYFTGVSRMRGSVAHLRIPVSCPISLRQYSLC
jgi:hypothetical protein